MGTEVQYTLGTLLRDQPFRAIEMPNSQYVWSSSNTSVGTVSSVGLFQALRLAFSFSFNKKHTHCLSSLIYLFPPLILFLSLSLSLSLSLTHAHTHIQPLSFSFSRSLFLAVPSQANGLLSLGDTDIAVHYVTMVDNRATGRVTVVSPAYLTLRLVAVTSHQSREPLPSASSRATSNLFLIADWTYDVVVDAYDRDSHRIYSSLHMQYEVCVYAERMFVVLVINTVGRLYWNPPILSYRTLPRMVLFTG